MVGVSRQALDEALELIDRQADALDWVAKNYANQDLNHMDFRVEAARRVEAALTPTHP